MSLFTWNRSRKSKSWSAPRRPGRNAVRPQIEGLEERLALSVSTQVVNGTLLVTNNGTDNITLDHSNGTTFVEAQSFGRSFADGSIYNGISLNIGGLSTLNIKANALPIAVEGNNAVATVNLGNSLHGVQDIKAVVNLHHLALSQSPPFAVFVPQLTFELNVDDSADQNPRSVTLDAANKVGTITGLAPATINYDYEIEGAGNVDIRAGSASAYFTVHNTFDDETGGLSPTPATTIHGNPLGGDVTVDVQGAVLGSDLKIDAPGYSAGYVNVGNYGTLNGIDGEIDLTGHSSVVVTADYDTTPRNFQVSSNGINLVDSQGYLDLNAPYITYDNNAFGVSIYGGPGGNTVDVLSTAPKASTEIYPSSWGSQSYDNTVNVEQTTGPLYIEGDGGSLFVNFGHSTGSVQGILGSVTVANYGGLAELTVWNYADPNYHTVYLTSANGVDTIKGLTPNSSTISYNSAQIYNVGIDFSGGDNEVFVDSLGVYTSLYGGSGYLDVYVGYDPGTLDGIHAELDVTGGSGGHFLGIYDPNSYYYSFNYSYTANPPANTWGHFYRTGGNKPFVDIYYMNMGAPYVAEGYGQ
jgi:hypothetical protein